jgi:hypothetical protein
MNVQPLREDFVLVGNDSSHRLHESSKASLSISARMSLHIMQTDRTTPSYNIDAFKDKLSISDRRATTMPLIDSPKTVRYSNANDSHSMLSHSHPAPPESSSMPIPDSSYMDKLNHPSPYTPTSWNLSYEQETWRLYHRIQTSRIKRDHKLPLLPLPNDLLSSQSTHSAAELDVNDIRRMEDDTDPIIFDLEL